MTTFLREASEDSVSISGKEFSSESALDALTDDALRHIFSHLGINERTRCDLVCRRWHRLLRSWHDVKVLVLGRKFIGIGNSHVSSVTNLQFTNLHGFHPAYKILLQKCFAAQWLIVHDARMLQCASEEEWKAFTHIQTLCLPNTAFTDVRFSNQTALNIVMASRELECLHVLTHADVVACKLRLFAPAHVEYLQTKCLQVVHLQGVVLGPKALEMLAEKCAETVTELRIGAVVVHTPAMARYWSSIAKFKKLRKLELPPSLFSVSRPLHSTYLSSLLGLTTLETLMLYVCRSGHEELATFLNFVPRSIKLLHVRQNSGHFEHATAELYRRRGIKLHFLPNVTAKLKWPFTSETVQSTLLVRALWTPPFFPETELANVHLTPEMAAAQVANWDCSLFNLEAMETMSLETIPLWTAQAPAPASSTLDTAISTARESSPIVTEPEEEREHVRSAFDALNDLLSLIVGPPTTAPVVQRQFDSTRAQQGSPAPISVSPARPTETATRNRGSLVSTPAISDVTSDGSLNVAFMASTPRVSLPPGTSAAVPVLPSISPITASSYATPAATLSNYDMSDMSQAGSATSLTEDRTQSLRSDSTTSVSSIASSASGGVVTAWHN